MSQLFSKLKIRDVQFKNRIFVSPMCQYSCVDGVPTDWHLVHLGSRAVGGASLVMAEATAITPDGRISPGDTGLWNEEQIKSFSRIVDFVKKHDSIPAIQLAHAGRKASTNVPWKSPRVLMPDQGGWIPLGPSAIAFDEVSTVPEEMTITQIKKTISDFGDAASRALAAGFDVAEVHMAHGYLLHEFLSPLSNQRKDEYGGALENRMRFPLEVARLVRSLWPSGKPVFARISATDWVEGGWTLDESVILSQKLKEIGIDLIDCSSGGSSPKQRIPTGPGYQVHLSETIRKNVSIMTGAVGLITTAEQAEEILAKQQSDVVFLARELLRDPYWPLHAAKKLSVDVKWPDQYLRAKD